MNGNRTKLGWNEKIWNRIDEAVHAETMRTKVGKKFLPLYGPLSPGTLTVPSDTVLTDEQKVLNVSEGAMTPLIELLDEFILTPQQVEREEGLRSAVTLATRAANELSQGVDVIILQGKPAVDEGPQQHPLFKEKKVLVRSGPVGDGLLSAPLKDIQKVTVPALNPGQEPKKYGENTFAKVAEAYSRLQSGEGLAQAHYGPYALVLHHEAYADTYAPLATTLIMPADRIKPLVTEGFYGTGTLPRFTGILVSLGGTMDLAVGMDATTEFMQVDTEGRHRFRVVERFALRLKDVTSRIILEFEDP